MKYFHSQNVSTSRNAHPSWFNNQIETLIEKKNHYFKAHVTDGRLVDDRVKLQKAGAELINVIQSSKDNF